MSTSAILPMTGIDFGASTASASQQNVFSNLLNQLQQAIGSGDLTTTATLLKAIDALSPTSATGSNPLGTFLTSLGRALNGGSVSDAQSKLATCQSATPASTRSAASTTNTSTPAANITAGLIQSQIQLNLVTTLLNPAASSSNSSNSFASGLLSVLAEAYPADGGSSSSVSSSSPSTASDSSTSATEASTTPYDTLVSSIQASLAGGNGTITPALAYLEASGNFVNPSA
jgi:peptidoglycan DL-endopeptidase CwlO